MNTVTVRGADTLYYDAQQGSKADQPNILFVHGSGCDHSVWSLQSRYFAFHGYNLYSVNLPGHGVGTKVSGGERLTSIEDMGVWLLEFMDAVGIEKTTLVGHSMGSLVAIEAAAAASDRIEHLILMGATAKMPVHPELLRASDACEEKSVDLMMDWGHGQTGHKGGNIAAGTWAKGGAKQMIMPRVNDGTLGIDMAACNAYEGGEAALGKINCKTTVISAQNDKMTPAKNGKAIAAAIEGASFMLLEDTGHMMLGEKPNECLAALKRAVG